MAVNNYDDNEFMSILNDVLSPSDAIRSPENLKGREQALREISRNLKMKGRHIFIYGDRGVGKVVTRSIRGCSISPFFFKFIKSRLWF